ncbi:MAG: aspartyl protease family protein [Desulfobacterales bacterium]
MDFNRDVPPWWKSRSFLIAASLIAFLHVGAFGLYFLFDDDHKALFARVKTAPVKNDRQDVRHLPQREFTPQAEPREYPRSTRHHRRLPPPEAGPGLDTGPRQKIYSWKDENGVPHYSTEPPIEPVENLRVSNAIVSDDLGDSEKVAAIIDPAPTDSRKTNILVHGNRVMVPVRMGYRGKEVQTLLLLDTGASITSIHRAVANRLDFRDTRRANFIVADGRTVTSGVGNLDYIAVGPHSIRNFKVSVIDYEGRSDLEKGLLGMDFLKRFSYSIDLQEQRITWR